MLKYSTKYIWKSKEIKQNRSRAENLRIYFCLIFDHLRQTFMEERLDSRLSSKS